MADKLNIPGFKHYELDSIYQAKIAAGEVDPKDLSFVKETGKLYTQGGEYGGGEPKWSYLKGYGAGTIVYHDGTKLKKVSPDKWNASLGTPVGVIVVPKGFAPDGKERIVALQYVNDAEGTAGEGTGLQWCHTFVSPSTQIYESFPITDNSSVNNTATNTIGYFPSDLFTNVQSFVDSKASYSGYGNRIPSPYLGENVNSAYFEELSGGNALSDMNGIQNTSVLLNPNYYSYAAQGAHNYSDGVSGLQWYLPAFGELGFLMVRLKTINDSLSVIGGIIIKCDNSSNGHKLYSSTARLAGSPYYITAYNGHVNYGKSNNIYVRPFAIID